MIHLSGSLPGRCEEAELLRRCAAGDKAAQEELCRRYWRSVQRMAHRIAGEVGEIEDLVQECFYRLLTHVRSLRGEARLTTWLYRTLINLYRDAAHKAARRKESPLEEVSSAALDPAVVVEGRLWRQRLVQAVKKLSRRDRKVLWLHFRREYSHAQIADRLNCTVDAVKCRLYRTVRHLRQELSFEI